MSTHLMSGTMNVTIAKGVGYDRANGGLCIVAVRTKHAGGMDSILRLDCDSYYDGTNAFLACGGVFTLEQCDPQIGWNGETVSYDVNENTTVSITPDTFGE